jgi:riboflavin kinase/FMN adenylyltransferase
LSGTVIRGAHRGKDLGFPTANLDIDSAQLPPSGVYAARIRIDGESRWRPAAANIGTNPTFGEKIRKLEIHLLHYQDDLYGRVLEVKLVSFIRPGKRYNNRDDLIQQMKVDCRQAERLLKADPM